ncbi:Jag N-terminal domain-containing protein [Sulfurimonas sp.]|uniref:Jag N-terminal domain-containing protein n=1 Tax=Sulfurimonas sp. TaxID=2022749 RepID=UPI0025D55619|nr:Jag N-terminal domain-containing protein [Sulfurimonas sp.]MBW6487854.1 Jag N-terminal domain-containing protein [Sulfurimonas sp.]
MIKIESTTLEQACKDAASALGCSASELVIEIVQIPSNGFMGLFKKSAIIVAAKKNQELKKSDAHDVPKETQKREIRPEPKIQPKPEQKLEPKKEYKQESRKPKSETKNTPRQVVNDTFMPQSFVSIQDDDDYDMADINYTADYEEEGDEKQGGVPASMSAYEVATRVEREINELFDLICFKIDKIKVTAYDEATLLVEFKGEDAALLIGKEGYRYKALSYMIFNWINAKYQLQLRLEIAEFLKNQEESVARYLVTVCENVDRDGRAQTKILDGVLIQIALKELRDKYPNKYVAVRSTREGLKFIIINDYHN